MAFERYQLQLFFVLLGTFTEGLYLNVSSMQQLYPYAGFLVHHFDMAHDKSTTGYYAGVITCALMTGRTISSPIWGWIIDTWGRKPVLLCGLFFAMSLSIAFGFVQNYTMAVLIRFGIGLFAPLSVVTKTCVSEVCPEDKQASAMSYYSMIWLSSSVVGSVVGGVLVDPKSTGIAPSGPLADYPFLLPNLITAIVAFCAFVGVFIWLDETLTVKKAREAAIRQSLLGINPEAETKPLTYRDLLKDKVIVLAITIYGINSFCSTAYFELFPLWCYANRSNGGLDFEPLTIGYALAASNLSLVIFQRWLFRKMVAKKGYLWNVLCGSLFQVPSIFIVPWISYSNNVYGIWIYIIATSMIWYFLSFQVLTAQFVMTNNCVLKTERGKLNGLAMMAGSFSRAIAPLFMGILFARTATSGLPFPLNFTFCFNMVAVLCLFMWFLSRYLPPSIQKTKEANLKEQMTAEMKTARNSIRKTMNAAGNTRGSVVRTSIISETGYYHEDDDLSDEEEATVSAAGSNISSSKL